MELCEGGRALAGEHHGEVIGRDLLNQLLGAPEQQTNRSPFHLLRLARQQWDTALCSSCPECFAWTQQLEVDETRPS